MHRRSYLGTLASGVGLFGGCLGGKGTDRTTGPMATLTPTETATPTATQTTTETPTETSADTPTETDTPDPEPLRIERASLLWSTNGPNPVLRNAVDSAGVGGDVLLGVRIRVDIDVAEFRPGVDGRILDEHGTQVDTISRDLSESIEDPKPTAFPFWLPLDTTGYSQGSFTCELTAVDREHDGVSASTRFDFDLVEPLDTDEVELRDFSPDTVSTGEPFTWELTFRNLAERTSDLQGHLAMEVEGSRRGLGPISWTLPGLSTVTHERGELEFDEPVTLRFVVAEHDIAWEIEVVE